MKIDSEELQFKKYPQVMEVGNQSFIPIPLITHQKHPLFYLFFIFKVVNNGLVRNIIGPDGKILLEHLKLSELI